MGRPTSGRPTSGRPTSGRPPSARPTGGQEPRPTRDESRPKPEAPPIPPEVKYEDLDKETRARLRSLTKGNAEDIGRHLMMVGLLLDDDPETAYLHAQVAVSRGGRIDVVREVAAIAAYTTGRYAEALREFRTVRRLSGSAEHLALEADCERGLGRPARAVSLAQSPEASTLSRAAAIELQIVVAGARQDMGDPEAALLILQRLTAPNEESAARVKEAMVEALRTLGREEEARNLAATLPDWDADADEAEADVIVYDLEEEGP